MSERFRILSNEKLLEELEVDLRLIREWLVALADEKEEIEAALRCLRQNQGRLLLKGDWRDPC